jgi:hypothetical protein
VHSAGRKPSAGQKEQPACFWCDGPRKCKTYSFYAGFCEGTKETGYFRLEGREFTTRYRNVGRYSVFLCRECARVWWLTHYIKIALVWTALLLALLVAGLVFKTSLPPQHRETATLVVVLGVSVLAVVAIGVCVCMGMLLTPKRETMEQLVIAKARRRFPEWGDSFFTKDMYQNLDRSKF